MNEQALESVKLFIGHCGLKNIADIIVVRKGVTNGEIIKYMFPNVEETGHCIETEHDVIRHYLIGEEILRCSDSWWNAPYKESEEE